MMTLLPPKGLETPYDDTNSSNITSAKKEEMDMSNQMN